MELASNSPWKNICAGFGNRKIAVVCENKYSSNIITNYLSSTGLNVKILEFDEYLKLVKKEKRFDLDTNGHYDTIRNYYLVISEFNLFKSTHMVEPIDNVGDILNVNLLSSTVTNYIFLDTWKSRRIGKTYELKQNHSKSQKKVCVVMESEERREKWAEREGGRGREVEGGGWRA